jgi:hypothetical protein
VSIVSRDDALVFSILLPATDPAVVFRGLRISMLPRTLRIRVVYHGARVVSEMEVSRELVATSKPHLYLQLTGAICFLEF